LAINPHAGSSTLTIYLQGGGACWSYGLCGGNNPNQATASYLQGYGAADVVSDALTTYQIFDRTDPDNPLADDNYIFIPYCTGDVHAGNNVTTYVNGDGGTLTISHVGYANVGVDLATVLATFPAPIRLVVTGSSAGGYGSTFNYGRIHAAYPGVPAFLIDDSGPPLPTPYGTVAWYDAQATAWGDLSNLPSGCTQCAPSADGGGLDQLLPFYAQDPGFRGSLLETEHDEVISAYYSLPPGDPNEICYPDGGGPCQFEVALNDLYQNVIQPSGPGQWHVFFVDDVFHTFLVGGFEPALKTFLWEQLGDAGTWSDVVP
jgi:hypothetical protein